jgi:integrase/ribosomal protein L40E
MTSEWRNPDRFLSTLTWLSKSQLETLRAFEREKAAQNMAKGTRYVYLFSLSKLAKAIKKPFKSATKDDIIDFLKAYSWYKSRSLKVSVKAFYKWLYGRKDYPPCVDWIKTHGFEKRKLPEEILTRDEVKRLVEAAHNPRNRALLMVLYESGARAGELLNIRIKHIQFDQYGAQVMLDGKTGMRRIRLIDSVPDLKLWLNHHPRASDAEAHLFSEMRHNGDMKSHNTLAHIVRAAANKAGITKRIYPHLFRHSRATHLAQEFTEQELKVIFGWAGGSKMPATYVHLSGGDIDNKMLERRGMIKREDKTQIKILEFKACEKCSSQNTPVAKFCQGCGYPMGNPGLLEIERAKEDANSVMNILMNDKIFRTTMHERANALGLGKKLA